MYYVERRLEVYLLLLLFVSIENTKQKIIIKKPKRITKTPATNYMKYTIEEDQITCTFIYWIYAKISITFLKKTIKISGFLYPVYTGLDSDHGI